MIPEMSSETGSVEKSQPIFRDISADDDAPEITEMESLCMNCHEQGVTRLLLTKIPYFKEVIISSFECPSCFCTNNEIQSGGAVQEQGVRITLHVRSSQDMNRQVVRQASASFYIKELDFEAPSFTTKGVLTTVEGLLSNAVTGLEQNQPVRKAVDPDTAEKIDVVIDKLRSFMTGDVPFTLVLEDISGNSYIENRFAPEKDPQVSVTHFRRNKDQNESLGIIEREDTSNLERRESADAETFNPKTEVLDFPTNCDRCGSAIMAHMKVLDIPHFKEAVIMASSCDRCGSKSSEVKGGGGMEPYGTRLTLRMTDPSDLSRDVLKSETCSLSIPDLDLTLAHASMGGRFTTLEGLLVNIKDDLAKVDPFWVGDSAIEERRARLASLRDNLDRIIAGELLVTIVLDDPVGNSYIQNTYAPEDDPELKIEKYQRTHEQDEELGIADMKTENYEAS